MKPHSISNLNSNYNSQSNQNLNKKQTMLSAQKMPKDSVTFGSAPHAQGIGAKIQNGLTKVFKFTDGLNFFFEFLIVDSISMISPRIWVGLNRDKEKTGHYNYKAAKEEAGRELLSGPSMNLIPMSILTAICLAKPATKLNRETLRGFQPLMEAVIEKTPKDKLKDKATLHKGFAEKAFDEIFGQDQNIKELEQHKNEFCEKLIKATEEKRPFICMNKSENAYYKAENAFGKVVDELNNMRKNAPINSASASIGNDGNTAKSLFNDFRLYSKDIIEKFVKEPDKTDFIKKLTTSRNHIKTATAITAFLAVGSFLLYLPKLYQQKGGSPAHESAERAKNETKGVA